VQAGAVFPPCRRFVIVQPAILALIQIEGTRTRNKHMPALHRALRQPLSCLRLPG